MPEKPPATQQHGVEDDVLITPREDDPPVDRESPTVEQERNDSPVHQGCAPYVYKTRHAHWLAYVLGDREAVIDYDKVRHQARSGSSVQHALFRQTMERMKTSLLVELQRLQANAAAGDTTASNERRRKVSEQPLNS